MSAPETFFLKSHDLAEISVPEEPGDDPRYGDIYRHPPPPYADPPPRYADPRYPPYTKPRYEEPYGEPRYAEPRYAEPRDEPSYRWSRNRREWGGRSEYLEPMPYPPRFAEHYAGNGHDPAACVPSHEIRRELNRDGWSDFRELELRDDAAIVMARRPNGQVYRLKIDRCSGQILRARPLQEHAGGYSSRRWAPYWSY